MPSHFSFLGRDALAANGAVPGPAFRHAQNRFRAKNSSSTIVLVELSMALCLVGVCAGALQEEFCYFKDLRNRFLGHIDMRGNYCQVPN